MIRFCIIVPVFNHAGTVRGVVVKVGGAALGWATMQELRAGLVAFAASGKPVVAWSETFGEGGNGSAAYVLASAASTVLLQPTGELGLLGVSAETARIDAEGIEHHVSAETLEAFRRAMTKDV